MKSARTFKSLLILIIGILALFEVIRIGQGIVRHGGIVEYWDFRQEASRLEKAVDLINAYYVDGEVLEGDRLTESALEGIIGKLDPYSDYLDFNELSHLEEETTQEFGGIGIQVEMRDSRLTIVAPIEGTPGERAGLLRGDQIVKVEDDDIVGLKLGEIINQLRGKPGSQVSLTIHRPSSSEDIVRVITRELIEIDNVKGVSIIEGQIGYLRILEFGRKTAEEMLNAIDQLRKQGMEALVIDLRNNPGGLLDSAVGVVEPFLDRGNLIVYTVGRNERSNDQWYSDYKYEPYDFPMAILVNSGSASASEIVAGALKDANRAIIVGDKTFGKGSVQSILPLGDGVGIKLTTAKFYTPAGYVIHENGIEPEVKVEISVDEERKLGIQRRRLHLMSEEEFVAEFEFEPIEDRQLNAAVDALKNHMIGSPR